MPFRPHMLLALAALAGPALAASEEEPARYDPHGRRDPFASLLATPGRLPRARLERFLVHEVVLKGIVRTPRGTIVVLLGPDGRSYFAAVGDRLFDGALAAVEGPTVTFRQEVADALSKVVGVRRTLDE